MTRDFGMNPILDRGLDTNLKKSHDSGYAAGYERGVADSRGDDKLYRSIKITVVILGYMLVGGSSSIGFASAALATEEKDSATTAWVAFGVALGGTIALVLGSVLDIVEVRRPTCMFGGANGGNAGVNRTDMEANYINFRNTNFAEPTNSNNTEPTHTINTEPTNANNEHRNHGFDQSPSEQVTHF
ncbi:unnamed protein product [Caenorhabditis brenneri]